MPVNPLQRDLTALQRLVAFAQGQSAYPGLLLEDSGGSLVTISTTTYTKALALSAPALDRIRSELRTVLRALASGEDVQLLPIQIAPHVVKHAPATSRSRRSGGPAAGL